jgi:hypothetical protein
MVSGWSPTPVLEVRILSLVLGRGRGMILLPTRLKHDPAQLTKSARPKINKQRKEAPWVFNTTR